MDTRVICWWVWGLATLENLVRALEERSFSCAYRVTAVRERQEEEWRLGTCWKGVWKGTCVAEREWASAVRKKLVKLASTCRIHLGQQPSCAIWAVVKMPCSRAFTGLPKVASEEAMATPEAKG